MAEYSPAPTVAEIAHQLIHRVEQHHNLVDAHIEYVFIKEAPKTRGREVWGRARKIGGLGAWIANPQQTKRPALGAGFTEPWPFFVIEISHDVWTCIDDSQRVALVDHELSHCVVEYDEDSGEPKLGMRHHDVEEFLGVITRNGLWKQDVQSLGIAASEQLSLALDRIPAQAAAEGAE
jgi:hypothetical protein